MTRSRVYRDGRLEIEDVPPEDLPGYLDDPHAVVWVDLARPTEADLAMLADKLGLHELAVRDATRAHQRPRLNHYQGHALVITYLAVASPKTGTLHAHELAIFVTPQTVVTVRKDDGIDPALFTERWDNQSELAVSGVSFLLYGILDQIVNAHLDVLQVLDDHVESLEEAVFNESPTSPAMQRRMLRMHKSLGQLRRKVVPMEPVLNSLMRRETAVFDERMVPYYQDALDHVLYASDQIESLRDLIATVRDTQLNLQGNRMNLIMKKVTSWAGIIAVPTLITGFYGQNVPVPGVGQTWGFWLSTVSMVLVSILMYASFKRKDWL